jgi:septal ring factor EnvC (AmiA/AmiB activator)
MKLKTFFAALLLAGFCCSPIRCLGADEQNLRININQLREQIAEQEEQLRQSGEQELTVLDELDQISSRMEEQQEKILVLQKHLQRQQQTLAKTKEVLSKTMQARDQAKQRMLRRLRAFYMMGRLGVLNVTFSNKTLPELMLMMDSFRSLAGYDQSVIDRYKKSLAVLEQAETAYELEASLQEELLRQAEEQQKKMQVLRQQQEDVLTRIKAQQGLYRLAVEEMRQAEAEMKRTLTGIKARKQNPGQGLLSFKGKLPFPAKGKVTLHFGEVLKSGLRKGETVKGIHIEVKPGAEVQAVEKGRVAFAGWRRGYGNAVIIDHGRNWFTITSRLDSIAVREGDIVRPGQKIGVSGDLATLYEPGLYFEIRQGTGPQDPLLWLKAD